MKRLRALVLLFFVALLTPLAYLVWHTYRSLEQEALAELRYFGETLFVEMERSLSELVKQEENRPVDAYTPTAGGGPAPLAIPSDAPYLMGYLQYNPDGSLIFPETESPSRQALPETKGEAIRKALRDEPAEAMDEITEPEVAQTPKPAVVAKKEAPATGFADRYLSRARVREKKVYLGNEQRRVERLTPQQAANLSQQAESPSTSVAADKDSPPAVSETGANDGRSHVRKSTARNATTEEATPLPISRMVLPPERLEAEVNPLQSVFIDDDHVFMFRRVVLEGRMFRQGFILRTRQFMDHLAAVHFSGQPMSRFTRLVLTAEDRGAVILDAGYGVTGRTPMTVFEKSFPRPFNFLLADLRAASAPPSAGRRTLDTMVACLAGVMVLGLLAIYRSAAALVDLADRRAKFVSSVTHELKTPLTNIRMYIEMLEQGIAATPEREQEYYQILKSEGGRLSRLITNILEFSKLERKKLNLRLTTGTMGEVVRSVQEVMGESIRKAGFSLQVVREPIPAVVYDREMMIQVLINLIENSLKFGQESDRKEIRLSIAPEGKTVRIAVSDTGPGIPRQDLKKVFDDFYRVESALVRSTRGTGIGLAFVKKVTEAMGGRIAAINNDGPGCTISLVLPVAETGNSR